MEQNSSHIQGYPLHREDLHPRMDLHPRIERFAIGGSLDEPWASGQRKRYLASLLEAQESA